jgi:uncharacterized membrane-anchored protein
MTRHALVIVLGLTLVFWAYSGSALAVTGRPTASASASATPAASSRAGEAANEEPDLDVDAGAGMPRLHWHDGPDVIDLGHGAQIALPAGRRFLRGPEAVDLMEKIGNLYNDNLVGLVVSSDPDSHYLIVIRYDEEGYVKDDETIDSKALLDSILQGEPEYNEERKKRGFAPIHALGWSEEPRYDRTRHQVVWALLLSELSEEGGQTVNLNTRVLGRRGYVSVNLLCDPKDLPRYRSDGLALVSATTFQSGSRYEDFDKSKDRVAEYGLAGLILGGVGVGVAVKAAKVGLVAALWKPILAFFLAAKKAVIALFVGAAALARKLFGRRKAEAR